ncbi:MAG: histidinol dehydrogenase [Spirochaetaceae bacterium]|jgi:histidinol dehydrogenase|nr:histidinol dehydrogenase [Spirochaetaceae bacterium]
MKIIHAKEFDRYQEVPEVPREDDTVVVVVDINAAIKAEGDAALRRYAARFDRSSPEKLETPKGAGEEAWGRMQKEKPELAAALRLAADHIRRFAELQKAQFTDFEYEMSPGLFTGQRHIPIQRAGIYAPGGHFPLISSVLMGAIPAAVAGVDEIVLASPPLEDGLPDRRILAAAYLAGVERTFAVGGAQAVAAFAFGTETLPRVDIIAGPGNRYVATAKRLLFGQTGIDFVAGPTDVLIITDGKSSFPGMKSADIAAVDMLAQAEHDHDARARVLVPNRTIAERITAAIEKRLAHLATAQTARASLEAGGLIIIYHTMEEAVCIANAIAPEHLELHVEHTENWIPHLTNYGSLFTGILSTEALGDYSAGINHTLPTAGTARFTGGLSVRHFFKTVTSLRCAPGAGFEEARLAAAVIARAEGLEAHAASAESRG